MDTIRRRHVNITDYAGQIIQTLPHGILLTGCAGDRINVMTIGWGTLGIEWGEPMFTVFIRQGRYTRELLDQNPEFTLSIPPRGRDPMPVRLCGTHTGRNIDKFALAGLTPVPAETVSAPAILEYPLTLECRIVHRSLQPLDSIAPVFLKYYPQHIESDNCGRNKDPHIVYCGKIVSSYILETDYNKDS